MPTKKNSSQPDLDRFQIFKPFGAVPLGTYQHRGTEETHFAPVQSLAESGELAKTWIPVACLQWKNGS